MVRIAVHKAQGTHADLTALLDQEISGIGTASQRLADQVSLRGDTLETIVLQ